MKINVLILASSLDVKRRNSYLKYARCFDLRERMKYVDETQNGSACRTAIWDHMEMRKS